MNVNLLSKSYVFLIKKEELDLTIKKCSEYSFDSCHSEKSDITVYDSFDRRLLSKKRMIY